MACRCCQLRFCCDRVMASPCHGEWRCACEHHAHQVAAARKAPLQSAWKAAPGAGCPGWSRCRCGTHTAEMLHGRASLQLLLAEPYQPQLCAKSSWPHPYNPCYREQHSPQLNTQPLERKSEHLKEQLCNCLAGLCRASGSRSRGRRPAAFPFRGQWCS